MKFIVSKSLLADALGITGKAVSTNNIVPVLASYLFRIKNNTLEITGSNLQIFISKQIEISGGDFDALIAVPANRLFNLVKELPDQPLAFLIEKDAGNIKLTITAISGTYVFPVEDGKDFPDLKNSKEVAFTMEGKDLIAGITKTLFAVSNDELRPAMTGVLVSFRSGQVTYTGTNAAVLSTYSYPVEVEETRSFIVPSKILSILLSLSAGKLIYVQLDQKSIVFNIDESTVLKSRLIDERYPDYQAIIPKTNTNIFNIDKGILTAALRRITQFSEGSSHKVTLDIGEYNCSLKTENSIGETAFETLKHQYKGVPLVIGLDGKNMLSCLAKAESEAISLSFSTPKRPMLLREIGPDEAPDTNLMLLTAVTI